MLMDYQVDYHEYYMLQMLDAEIKLKAPKKKKKLHEMASPLGKCHPQLAR